MVCKLTGKILILETCLIYLSSTKVAIPHCYAKKRPSSATFFLKKNCSFIALIVIVFFLSSGKSGENI